MGLTRILVDDAGVSVWDGLRLALIELSGLVTKLTLTGNNGGLRGRRGDNGRVTGGYQLGRHRADLRGLLFGDKFLRGTDKGTVLALMEAFFAKGFLRRLLG